MKGRYRHKEVRELAADEPGGDGGEPGDGQKGVDERAEEIVGEAEGVRREFSVRVFQMDLVWLASHGCLRGTELANYENAYGIWGSL
jgi:hypothetical protein